MRIRTATLFERTFEEILSCGHKYYSRNTIKHLYTEYKKCRAILLDNPYYGQLKPYWTDFNGSIVEFILSHILDRLYC